MLRNRRGVVMPAVIFAITIMSVIAVVVMSTSGDERRASHATRESTLAMYAAEAGLRQTFGAWPVAAVKALKPGDSLDLGWQNMPNKAAYRTVIHRVDGGGLQQYSVVVQGRRTDPTAGIITIVAAAGGVPTFKYAVSTDSALYLNNGGLFDGYDSERGAYVAASADSTANLRSGVTTYIAQTLVKGDALSVGALTFGSYATVTGAKTTGIAPVPPKDIITCPVGGFTPAAKVPAGPGITYNALNGVLYVNGNNTLTLTDTAYYFSSIVLTNNAKLTFPGVQKVNIFLRDSLNASGGSVINQSASPPAVAFSSCGTSATPAYWALSSGAFPSYFSVYAPNHVVYELGGGDFYGAIVAWIYYATGGGKFHYDAALGRLPSSKLEVRRGSWAQLPGS